MNHTAIIFARGGSKGLPNKNIMSFCGKPLIAWAIEEAMAVKSIGRVIVSTDSLEIADIASYFGAEVPFLRPIELAGDDSPEWDAWRHAIQYLASKEKIPEFFISVPTTAPLRLPSDLENCVNEYLKGGADAVISITDSHRNPYFNMVKRSENNEVVLVNSFSKDLTRRQDAPATFDITTVGYVLKSEFVLSNDSLFSGKVRASYVAPERSIDIDTLFDFEIAEFLMEKRIKNYGA